jgi:hypothetical protein
MMSTMRKTVPRATDWMGATLMARLQQGEPVPPEQDGALYGPGRDGRVHGKSPHHVMRSAYTKASLHPALTSAILAGVGLTAAAYLARNRP